jgi:hypothetical protein
MEVRVEYDRETENRETNLRIAELRAELATHYPELNHEIEHSFWIYGEPASSKNQRQMVKIKGVSRLIKSKKALAYQKVFNEQCPVLDTMYEGDVSLRIDVWYGSRRPDLACIDFIQDLLQGKMYKNDRQVKAHMAVWNLARKQPRVRIQVRALPVTGFENNSLHYSTEQLFANAPFTDAPARTDDIEDGGDE